MDGVVGLLRAATAGLLSKICFGALARAGRAGMGPSRVESGRARARRVARSTAVDDEDVPPCPRSPRRRSALRRHHLDAAALPPLRRTTQATTHRQARARGHLLAHGRAKGGSACGAPSGGRRGAAAGHRHHRHRFGRTGRCRDGRLHAGVPLLHLWRGQQARRTAGRRPGNIAADHGPGAPPGSPPCSLARLLIHLWRLPSSSQALPSPVRAMLPERMLWLADDPWGRQALRSSGAEAGPCSVQRPGTRRGRGPRTGGCAAGHGLLSLVRTSP